MSLLECNIYSHSLGREVSVNVIMPHASKQFAIGEDLGRVPVLYLLHGLTENHTAWCRKSSIERYVTGKRLAVIMPDGGRSFYTDTNSGVKWFEFITHELPKQMYSLLPISAKRSDTFIAGLSMGGYGAFKAALTYPERYACAASLSGCVDVEHVLRKSEGTPERTAIFGYGKPEECDLYALAEKAAYLPALYQCCGTRDFLYEDNVKFREFISKKAHDYTYCEDDFEHEWAFWDIQIEKVINWLKNHNNNI